MNRIELKTPLSCWSFYGFLTLVIGAVLVWQFRIYVNVFIPSAIQEKAYWALPIGILPTFFFAWCIYELLILTLSCTRTIVLDQYGITIKRLKKERYFPWKEVTTRLLVNHPNGKGELFHLPTIHYSEAVYLYPGTIRMDDKLSRTRSPKYCLTYRIKDKFSFVFIYFKLKPQGKIMNELQSHFYPPIFQVEKEELIDHLRSWGVTLETY